MKRTFPYTELTASPFSSCTRVALVNTTVYAVPGMALFAQRSTDLRLDGFRDRRRGAGEVRVRPRALRQLLGRPRQQVGVPPPRGDRAVVGGGVRRQRGRRRVGRHRLAPVGRVERAASAPPSSEPSRPGAACVQEEVARKAERKMALYSEALVEAKDARGKHESQINAHLARVSELQESVDDLNKRNAKAEDRRRTNEEASN